MLPEGLNGHLASGLGEAEQDRAVDRELDDAAVHELLDVVAKRVLGLALGFPELLRGFVFGLDHQGQLLKFVHGTALQKKRKRTEIFGGSPESFAGPAGKPRTNLAQAIDPHLKAAFAHLQTISIQPLTELVSCGCGTEVSLGTLQAESPKGRAPLAGGPSGVEGVLRLGLFGDRRVLLDLLTGGLDLGLGLLGLERLEQGLLGVPRLLALGLLVLLADPDLEEVAREDVALRRAAVHRARDGGLLLVRAGVEPHRPLDDVRVLRLHLAGGGAPGLALGLDRRLQRGLLLGVEAHRGHHGIDVLTHLVEVAHGTLLETGTKKRKAATGTTAATTHTALARPPHDRRGAGAIMAANSRPRGAANTPPPVRPAKHGDRGRAIIRANRPKPRRARRTTSALLFHRGGPCRAII